VLRWLLDHPAESELPTGLLTGLGHPKLARALAAMHERPGDAWTLDAMASCAGMSRSAFALAFKQHVGQTPAEYLACWRLTIAQSLLRGGSPLKSVSDQLGYASSSSLSRAFTQVVGTSPRAWMKASAIDA
jgi:AraC-like DNA-binding protein